MDVCHKCGKLAVGRMSPDIDVRGIAYCEDCRDIVEIAYICLLQGDMNLFNSLMQKGVPRAKASRNTITSDAHSGQRGSREKEPTSSGIVGSEGTGPAAAPANL